MSNNKKVGLKFFCGCEHTRQGCFLLSTLGQSKQREPDQTEWMRRKHFKWNHVACLGDRDGSRAAPGFSGCRSGVDPSSQQLGKAAGAGQPRYFLCTRGRDLEVLHSREPAGGDKLRFSCFWVWPHCGSWPVAGKHLLELLGPMDRFSLPQA